MRCISCNKQLNDFEATRKYEDGTFVDMCKACSNSSDMENIIILERADLAHEESEESDSDCYDIVGPEEDFVTLKAPIGYGYE